MGYKTVLGCGILSVQEAVLAGSLARQATISGGHSQATVVQGTRGVQSQDDILTESLVRKRGCLIFEPLEVVEVGLWLLSGQAGGVQSQLNSSGCSHRACF